MFSQISLMSLKALKTNKLRTLLTTLGVVIGTAIVVIVLSVGLGIESLVLNQVSTITAESLYVEIQVPSATTNRAEKDQNTAQSIAQGVQVTTMKLKDLEDLKKIDNIKNGYPLLLDQRKLSYKNKEKVAMVYITDENYPDIESTPIAQGRFFTKRENDSLANVIVLGSDLKTSLFGQRPALNENVKIEGKTYKVVGVADQIGTKFFMNMDEIAYIPVKNAHKKLLGHDHLQAMALEMRDSDLIGPTISQIQRIMRKNHKITDVAKDDFVVRTLDQAMDIIGGVTTGVSILLLALASISLVVGGVGIMNIMYFTVTDRINEIGLKKAIGASPAAIKFQFLFEAVLITVIGGILGAIFGVLISWIVSVVATNLGFDWPFIFQISHILLAVVVAAVIGLIFGYKPAQKAAKLNPIDALRS
jgi:putative ABC transport system permease protein